MTTVFLLTFVDGPSDVDVETVLRAGRPFATLAGAQRAAEALWNEHREGEPEVLVWHQEDATQWDAEPEPYQAFFWVREVPIGD